MAPAVDWDARVSWGSPAARTTSRFFPDAVVKKYGRVFYDYFLIDGKRVSLYDCVGVALRDDDHTGDETSRVLELWEDTKGSHKGQKFFRGRWLFYPHHLPEGHKERARKRTGLDARQVYEQCDTVANDEENPLASVRSAQRVLCCWSDSRNRLPSEAELQAAHAWFDSSWDNAAEVVVPLSSCVDKAGHARFALLRSIEMCQPPPPPKLAAPASREAVGGARSAVGDVAVAAPAAPAPLKQPLPASEKPSNPVPKAPQAAAPKPVPASTAAPPKAAAKPAVAVAPPPPAKAAPKSNAAATASHAAPARDVAKAASTAALPATLGKLPSLKRGEGAALPATKPAVSVPATNKQAAAAAAAVGEKRRRAEAEPEADRAPKRPVQQQQQQPQAPQKPFCIPKTKQPAAAAAVPAPPATAAGGALHAALEESGPTLGAWLGKFRGSQIVRVSGLPLNVQHSEWKRVVKSAKLPVADTSVSGWVLPSATWQGSGTGYLLVEDKRKASAVLAQLNGMSLRCAATGLLRPLFADVCAAAKLAGDEPFIGHLELRDESAQRHTNNARSRDPIVPHFVQSNTLELDMSLQWRALVATQFGGRQGLRSSHVTKLARALRPE